MYDPRKGENQRAPQPAGEPGRNEDFYVEPKTGEVYDFVMFAWVKAASPKHFDKDANRALRSSPHAGSD